MQFRSFNSIVGLSGYDRDVVGTLILCEIIAIHSPSEKRPNLANRLRWLYCAMFRIAKRRATRPLR